MTEVISTQSVVDLAAIAEKFAFPGTVTNVQAFGSGNINDTFLVTVDSLEAQHFILQRINTLVFRQPELIMQNMRIFSDHVYQRLQYAPPNRRWEVPRVLSTKDNHDYCTDTQGNFWRAISFISGSQSFDTMQDLAQAQEIGYALGMFHNLISDLSPEKLADTLEGFHITPLYLRHYEQILATAKPQPSPELDYCLQFVSDRQSYACILENAKAAGELPLRLIHGDPKINNIMFDTVTHKAVSVIDLDTVKPGLVHYDIGDCLRSGCNPAGEETEHWESVSFDTDLCQGILQGYLSVAKDFLTDNDYAYMYDAIRLIAFELGLRFFADYLAGNVYFKIKYPEHNLARALVQFKLAESIESQEIKIRKIIQDIK
ncbi:phosphotransferase enzyme family protein [Nostoc parmelioides]|uniref:Aminoglycoside phosphotransferase family protein n=1 Tax=Nostoc parmelioides FACHB-3921 TaxID=2692909 RepID=A0ABR8B969_9NOSO|nr:aminoglycoside phosphotransferase family protein [Nostoc parmelioides]MBD2250490.1 aminoglycoside phosphotransferase family protein [Nostoc parmelioides FACHB-3921]